MIGSGATAVTLVPAMAETRRARDDAAALAHLHRRRCPARTRSPTALRKRAAARRPRTRSCAGRTSLLHDGYLPAQPAAARSSMKRSIAQGARSGSCRTATTSTRTSPRRYNPWDQRLCLVPDGDLFEAIAAARRRSSPTTIETFTETGHRARVRRASSRPTSSSPRPASTCSRSAACELDRRRRATVDVSRDDRLQGHDVQRRARTSRSRSATRTRRGRCKCDLICAVRLPAAQPHGRATATTRCTPRDRDRSITDASRSSTSRRATCCARSTTFPKQGVAAPWRLYQNYVLRHGRRCAIARSTTACSSSRARPTAPAQRPEQVAA